MKKVTDQRWREAQNWEKNFWNKIVRSSFSLKNGQLFKTLVKMGIRYGLGNDSNHWWAEQFDNYKFVPEELNNVVEFGCGPFTNLRIISRLNLTIEFLYGQKMSQRLLANLIFCQVVKICYRIKVKPSFHFKWGSN